MAIFVLIILCIYTISGIVNLIDGVTKDDGATALTGIFIAITGILAIVFQALSL